MVFGQGPHMCPGSELAITETMFLIHHLITNYRLVLCLGSSILFKRISHRRCNVFFIIFSLRFLTGVEIYVYFACGSWERYGPDQGVTQLPIRKPGGFPVTLVKRDVAWGANITNNSSFDEQQHIFLYKGMLYLLKSVVPIYPSWDTLWARYGHDSE
jgi:hypothetical protein